MARVDRYQTSGGVVIATWDELNPEAVPSRVMDQAVFHGAGMRIMRSRCETILLLV